MTETTFIQVILPLRLEWEPVYYVPDGSRVQLGERVMVNFAGKTYTAAVSNTDARKEASEMTTLIVKLETINNGVNEIKSDMRNMKTDIQDLRDRLIIVEQSTKSAHHRVDKLEGKKED